MKTAAIIVAAGTGTRFGGDVPKQYRNLAGKAILRHTYDVFAQHPAVDDIIIVIAQDAEPLFAKIFATPRPRFVFGGDSRTASVYAGLQALQNKQPEQVLIHDGARPFVSATEITEVLAALGQFDACAPALPIVDAIKRVDAITGKILADANRNQFQRVQTPQGFAYASLLAAYEQRDTKIQFDDDLSLAADAGMTCHTIAGNPTNIKITTQQNLDEAKRNMQPAAKIYVSGQGFDVHQLIAGDGMMLCGVHVPAEASLKGHSDADVGLHALTDAILGAMALGDIGEHFPPSDAQWKNANSSLFVRHAHKLAKQNGGKIIHVDMTLICETPKITPHRQDMRNAIAILLDLDISSVSVKATTTEKLGFAGRKEGIAAQACVSIEKASK
ncbi:2-C-methyl-D-erythritol 2,4-cyclodiphosphate synthase [hydrothermal vent metagenome]|uniref:2-C-methyl-D-erythritol 2,4-cyclodiphosphate synthase n=1 Tax=hydrothermal vent metagenome TaxID=652676 RepID=A0A3B0SNG8_9ZZZZ